MKLRSLLLSLAVAATLTGCVRLCPGGQTDCDGTCVELSSDAVNCGACGTSCHPAQACVASACACPAGEDCTYEVVAACSTDGQLRGIQAPEDELGSLKVVVGFRPQTLARFGDTLLVADVDNVLREIRLADFAKLSEENATGSSPNFILSEPPYAYLVNSLGNTFQVFGVEAQVPREEGLGLRTIGQLNLGANSSPQAIARLGDKLYVTLLGGYGFKSDWSGYEESSVRAGQKILELDVGDPRAPVLARTFELWGMELGRANTIPRPGSILARGDKLYFTLGNEALSGNPSESGPPLIGTLDPATGTVGTIGLDPGRCKNVSALSTDGTRLFASCLGDCTYAGPPDYNFLACDKTGVAMIDGRDVAVAYYNPTCGGAQSCVEPVASKSTVFGDKLYLGDQNGGKVFVLRIESGELIPLAGYGAPLPPLNACPPSSKSFSNVIDLITIR